MELWEPITNRKHSRTLGVLFIAAALLAMASLSIYTPLFQQLDSNEAVHIEPDLMVTGVVLELLVVCSVIGTAMMLYPYLKRYNPTLGMGYVLFRFAEAIVILLGSICILILIELYGQGLPHVPKDSGNMETIARTLGSIYRKTLILGPNFLLGINSMCYAMVMYKARLVPKTICFIGFIGSIAIFTVSLLELYGVVDQLSIWGMVMAIPIFLYEMSFAIFLIRKGFSITPIQDH